MHRANQDGRVGSWQSSQSKRRKRGAGKWRQKDVGERSKGRWYKSGFGACVGPSRKSARDEKEGQQRKAARELWPSYIYRLWNMHAKLVEGMELYDHTRATWRRQDFHIQCNQTDRGGPRARALFWPMPRREWCARSLSISAGTILVPDAIGSQNALPTRAKEKKQENTQSKGKKKKSLLNGVVVNLARHDPFVSVQLNAEFL